MLGQQEEEEGDHEVGTSTPVDDLKEILPLLLLGAQEDTPLLGQLKTSTNTSETCSYHYCCQMHCQKQKF